MHFFQSLSQTGALAELAALVHRRAAGQTIAEWTVEMAPACVTEARLEVLREAGVNRISIGVQSFQPALLDALGRQHSREQVSQQMTQGLAVQVGAAILGVGQLGQQVAQTLLDVTFNLPHSRTDETEADRIGVELAARAGYDPRAAVNVWKKMSAVSGGQPPQILSTHPAHGP